MAGYCFSATKSWQEAKRENKNKIDVLNFEEHVYVCIDIYVMMSPAQT